MYLFPPHIILFRTVHHSTCLRGSAPVTGVHSTSVAYPYPECRLSNRLV